MKLRPFFIMMLSITVCLQLPAQEADKTMDKTIQKGNDLYKQKQYQQAEAIYNEVMEKDPANMTAKFNKADALYRQAKNEEAIKLLDDLAFKTVDKDLKSKAYYNKGVILSGQKRLEESIEAYKNALRQNPEDKDARENLQKALLELKKKEPPPKKEDNKKQQQQQKKQPQPQPKMNQKEAEQRLKLLEQKEKDVQQRLQKEKSKQGGGQQKDW
jgi:Ca-activated chloride channel homolog